MTALTPELGTWLLSLKNGAAIILIFWLLVLLVYNWLVKADPAAFIRGLLNIRARRLEEMLKNPVNDRHARTLIRREIAHYHHLRLTGLADHRLQRACIRLCVRQNLNSRYFAPWRRWLEEEAGYITFNDRWYGFSRKISAGGILFITLLLLGLTGGYMHHYGIANVPVFMILNITVWWGPLLVLLYVPGRLMTENMLLCLEKYNASLLLTRASPVRT